MSTNPDPFIFFFGIGFIAIVAFLGYTIQGFFADVVNPYLRELLALDVQKRRAEHEAKIKLIKGLD